MKFSLKLLILMIVLSCISVAAQRSTTLRGQVSDELGGVIVGATITLTNAQGVVQTIVSDANGNYRFATVPAGTYSVGVAQPGFASFQQANVTIHEGQTTTLNATLRVATLEGQVTVDPGAAVNTDPNTNKSAVVLKGNDLNALSDDPNELSAELSALAGPAAGPSGAQVLVDGFTSGPSLPDKASIREIVINQNPFSAEWERIGFGNIQIFTRPGAGQLHGFGAFTFSDAAFNSRNPYAGSKPDYQRRIYDGGLNGPLSKRSSFFVNFGRREIDDTAAVNALVLNNAFQPVPFSEAVVTPRRNTFVSPRFDFQLNKIHSLSARYNYNSNDFENVGVGGFALASRGVEYSDQLHIFQLIDTAIINPTTANEAAFQYIWYYIQQTTNDPSSGLIVLDAFSGGGSQIGKYTFTRGEGEVRDYLTLTRGQHTLKLGGRLRWARISDIAPTNFGGTFTFAGGKAPTPGNGKCSFLSCAFLTNIANK